MENKKPICARLLLLSVSFFIGCCGPGPDDIQVLKIMRIENRSAHDLEVESEGTSYKFIPKKLQIKSGETFSVSGKTDEGYLPWTAVTATVRFGADVVTVHRTEDRNEYHNFCFPPLYVTDTGYRTQSHTFTFTDLDYESAKKRPQFVSI